VSGERAAVVIFTPYHRAKARVVSTGSKCLLCEYEYDCCNKYPNRGYYEVQHQVYTQIIRVRT